MMKMFLPPPSSSIRSPPRPTRTGTTTPSSPPRISAMASPRGPSSPSSPRSTSRRIERFPSWGACRAQGQRFVCVFFFPPTVAARAEATSPPTRQPTFRRLWEPTFRRLCEREDFLISVTGKARGSRQCCVSARRYGVLARQVTPPRRAIVTTHTQPLNHPHNHTSPDSTDSTVTSQSEWTKRKPKKNILLRNLPICHSPTPPLPSITKQNHARWLGRQQRHHPGGRRHR